MRESCPTPDSNCPLRKCFGDTHHQYYPASQYNRPIEREFRNLSENKEFICRALHNQIHRTESPPPKPDLQFMLAAIRRYKGYEA